MQTAIKHFREMTLDEQMAYFNDKLFNGRPLGKFTRDFASQCIEALDQVQLKRFVDAATVQVSVITYPKDCTEEQARSPVTVQRYYYNCINPPLDLLFECLWSAVENYRL